MSLVSLVEWNVSLGSADVSWGGVRAIRTAAKETTNMAAKSYVFFISRVARIGLDFSKVLSKPPYDASSSAVDRYRLPPCCYTLTASEIPHLFFNTKS